MTIYSASTASDKYQQLDWAKGEGASFAPANGSIYVSIGKGEAAIERNLVGRFAWTAIKLIEAGKRGISAAELPPGVRLAHYIHRLRRDGLPIASEREAHSGAFSGTHAPYRLSGHVALVEGDA